MCTSLAGAEGVFRTGEWILGFSRHIGSATINTTEVWPIRDGLMIALQKRFSRLIAESVSQITTDLFRGNKFRLSCAFYHSW